MHISDVNCMTLVDLTTKSKHDDEIFQNQINLNSINQKNYIICSFYSKENSLPSLAHVMDFSQEKKILSLKEYGFEPFAMH